MTGVGAIVVDASARLALPNRDDEHFILARDAWAALLRGGQPLVMSDCVVVESAARFGRRPGGTALVVHAERLLAPVAVRRID